MCATIAVPSPRLGLVIDWRWASVVVLGIVVWGLTDVRSRGRVDPRNPHQRNVHMTDVTVYTEAGAAIFDGRDPYEVTNPRGWHYLYPPLFAMLLAPLAALDPQWQVVIWFAVSVLAGWGCLRECGRLWTWFDLHGKRDHCDSIGENYKFPNWLLFVAASAMLLPVLNCLQRGQLGIALLYLLLLGMRLAMTARRWWKAAVGGVVLALPVAIKLTPALPVVFVCWELLVTATNGKNRLAALQATVGVSAGVVVGLVLFLLAAPSAVVGPTRNSEFLLSWIHRVAANHEVGTLNDFNLHSARNQSLSNSAYLLGNWAASIMGVPGATVKIDDDNWKGEQPALTLMDQRAARNVILAARALLLVLLLVDGWKAARCGEPLAITAAFSLACMLTLLISPLSWAHHYVLWLPAVWLVPLWLWSEDRRSLAVSLLLAANGLVWIHYLFLPVAGRIGLLGVGATVWFTIAAAAMFQKSSSNRGAVKPAPNFAELFPARDRAIMPASAN
jgi:Glycosyltransferase family 87